MEDHTVVAAASRPRFPWRVAGGLFAAGLLLLNRDRLERIAKEAYAAVRAHEVERPRAAGGPATDASAQGDPRPESPEAPPATTGAAARAPAAPASRAETVAAVRPLPPLERLYAEPVVPAVRPANKTAGKAGLTMLVRSGVLRPVSGNALAAWKARYAASHRRPVPASFDVRVGYMPVYEIVGDMTFPEGFGGANAAVFLLGARAPYPSGDPGPSPILDRASGSCIGVTCAVLLAE